MIKKDQLLLDLKDDMGMEEEMIEKLSALVNALKLKDILSAEEHEKIRSSIKIMQTDSEKHHKLVADMVRYVNESERDEF